MARKQRRPRTSQETAFKKWQYGVKEPGFGGLVRLPIAPVFAAGIVYASFGLAFLIPSFFWAQRGFGNPAIFMALPGLAVLAYSARFILKAMANLKETRQEAARAQAVSQTLPAVSRDELTARAMGMLRFDAQDLEHNRRGTLTPQQQARLNQKARSSERTNSLVMTPSRWRTGLIWFCVFVFLNVVVLGDSSYWSHAGVLFGMGLFALAQSTIQKHRMDNGAIAVVQGRVKLEIYKSGGNSENHRIRVGGVTFRMFSWDLNAFKNHAAYRFYYVKGYEKIILSVEALHDA